MPTIKYLDSDQGRHISDRMPKWTVERTQAFSRTRRFGNILANVASDLNTANRPIGEARSLVTTRPTDYICENYITEPVDVSGAATAPFTATGVSYVSGEMDTESGTVQVALTRTTSEREYLDAFETGFFVRKEFALLGMVGKLKGEYNQDEDVIKLARVSDNYLANVNIGADVSESSIRSVTTISTAPAGELVTDSITKRLDQDDKSLLLNRPLPETIQIFLLTASGETELTDPGYQLDASGNALSTASGELIRFVPESAITQQYGSEYDLNKDGIIDEFDVALVREQVGKRMEDYDVDFWTAEYAKFDFDSDGLITDKDVRAIEQYVFATKDRRKSILYIFQPGRYVVRYQTTGDGNGLTSYRTIRRNGIEIEFKHGRPEVFPHSFLEPDALTFEYHPVNPNVLIAIHENECALTFYTISDINTLVDKYKISLPIDGIETKLIGSTIRDMALYVLAKVDAEYQVIRIELDTNNITQTITSLPIYQSKLEDKRIVRLPYQFTDPSDLVVIDGGLVVIDQEKLVFLGEVFDISYYDSINQRYYTRSRFDRIYLADLPAAQIYFNIWNKFDEYGLIRGIPRLPGEENIEYKRRLLELWTRFPNPGLQGSLNGFTREVGTSGEALDHTMFLDLPGAVVNPEQNLDIRIDNDLISIVSITPVPVLSTLEDILYNKFDVSDDLGVICRIDRGFVLFNKNHPRLYANVFHEVTIGCLVSDPVNGFSRSLNVTGQIYHNETQRVHIHYLSDPAYLLDPVNGWADASGNPTQKTYDFLEKIQREQGGFWGNSITDENFFDVRQRQNMPFTVDMATMDTPRLPSGDHISGIGDADDLAVVGVVRVKTDRIKDITAANILTGESGTFLQVSGEFFHASGELTPVVYDDLEQFHPVIKPGYLYLRDVELYAYSNKTTQLCSNTVPTNVFAGIKIYALSGEPAPHTPIVVEQAWKSLAAELLASGDFQDPAHAEHIFALSGDFTVEYRQLIANSTEPSGVANFHPGSRFAYTSGEARELVPTFNDIDRAVNYLRETGLRFAHINAISGTVLNSSGEVEATYYADVNGIISLISEPIIATYETGEPTFVEKQVDISPLTTGFEDTILSIGEVDNTPIYMESYVTSSEVVGESGAFIDLIVGAYNKDYSPVANVVVNVSLQRKVVNSNGIQVPYAFNGQVWNGLYDWDEYLYQGSALSDIILVNDMAGGVVDKNRKVFQTQSLGHLSSTSMVTNKDGVASVRYIAPTNDRKAFKVVISQLVDGWSTEQTVKTTLTVQPRNQLGFPVRGPNIDGVPEIQLKERFVTLESGSNIVSIEIPLGGYPDVSFYDAEEYTYLKRISRQLPVSGDHSFMSRFIPKMIPVSGEIISVSGDGVYNLTVPVESAGAVDAIMVYNLLKKESMIFDVGEVWR